MRLTCLCHYIKTDFNQTQSTLLRFMLSSETKNYSSHSYIQTMATYIKIDLHIQGVFINKPFCYSNCTHYAFEDVNFAGMNLKECVAFLERFTQKKKCEKLYYNCEIFCLKWYHRFLSPCVCVNPYLFFLSTTSKPQHAFLISSSVYLLGFYK